jgi:beta-phosphoglucomutase-like phosphatase (HAD superfamily)
MHVGRISGMVAGTDPIELDVVQPALLFDLDGTLVDSVYQHVIAWQEALAACGIGLSVWRIHRRIGMSGGLFLDALQRETGVTLDAEMLDRLAKLHAEGYLRRAEGVVPLPGRASCCVTCTTAMCRLPLLPAATATLLDPPSRCSTSPRTFRS